MPFFRGYDDDPLLKKGSACTVENRNRFFKKIPTGKRKKRERGIYRGQQKGFSKRNTHWKKKNRDRHLPWTTKQVVQKERPTEEKKSGSLEGR